MKIPGTVTISLDDYNELISQQKKTEELNVNTKRAAKEMAVFLTFLITRSEIEPFVEEFNRQSTSAKIVLEENRARIKFENVKNKNSS